MMTESITTLHYHPAHPLDMFPSHVIKEHEHTSSRWPGVTRYVGLFTDDAGYLSICVMFRPQDQPGNLDKARGYIARIAPAAEVADPKSAVADFIELGEDVETRYFNKLKLFYGEPGGEAPMKFHAR